MKTRPLLSAICAFSCAATMSASAALLVDRDLPTINLNNAAGGNRANVSWAFTQYTPQDYWMVGDTFQNTSAQTWTINTIRLWTTDPTETAVLWGGVDGSAIGVVSSTYSKSAVTYAGGANYETGTAGTFRTISQIDFAVNITLAPGQAYDFFLDGTGNTRSDITIPFVHASNAALSGSPQQGADDLMLAVNVVNGIAGTPESWTCAGWGWDKASDVNVQAFGTVVPEPTTMIAGALLLLPLGASSLRVLRNRRKA